jgi:hypothetical protein
MQGGACQLLAPPGSHRNSPLIISTWTETPETLQLTSPHDMSVKIRAGHHRPTTLWSAPLVRWDDRHSILRNAVTAPEDGAVACGEETTGGIGLSWIRMGCHCRPRRHARGGLSTALKWDTLSHAPLAGCPALPDGKQWLAPQPPAADGRVQQRHWRGVGCALAVHAWGLARKTRPAARKHSATVHA